MRLKDPLISALFENEEIIAVNKPYGVDTHTNDSKVGNEEFIQHGLIELFEKQLGQPLHIVHRLDRTTTGVIVFAKSLEAAKKYQTYFRERETAKTYVFVTRSRSVKDQLSCDESILHKGAMLEARTDFKRVARSSEFELWEAKPHTGRNHQIRIHGAALKIPILGDEKYGGENFPFLCLHNRRIEFPDGVVCESPLPVYFDDLEVLKDEDLSFALSEIDKRMRLFGPNHEDQSFRLFQEISNSEDREATLDQFGSRVVLSWYKENWTEKNQALYSELSRRLNKPISVLQKKSSSPIHIGSVKHESSWTASERNVRYSLSSELNQNAGVFLDQRLQTNWVFENAADRSVLSLFAYTCGMSVAAVLGKARKVTSVDMNKEVLNWGRKNFELNGLDPSGSVFLCRDATVYLIQCLKKSETFDLILCDPPSFFRGEKGVFRIENNLEDLLRNCIRVLSDEGSLLFSTSYEGLFVDDIRKVILKVQKELGLKNLEINSIMPSLDFSLPGEKQINKSFLIRKFI